MLFQVRRGAVFLVVNMNKKKIPIYTCIDDYGLGLSHNKIIREISRNGLVSGVSTFVGMANFGPEANALINVSKETSFEMGLHLDFTEFFPLIRRPIYLSSDFCCSIVIIFSLMRLLNEHSIIESIEKQLKKFKLYFNKAPDFIDGHYHLHQIPTISKILIEILKKEKFNGWIRSTKFQDNYESSLPMLETMKKRYLNHIGRKARKKFIDNFRTNHLFDGYTNLKSTNNYIEDFKKLLRSIGSPTLIMLHSGSSSDVVQIDGHSPQVRDLETEWLLGDFKKDCEDFNLEVVKDSKLLSLQK